MAVEELEPSSPAPSNQDPDQTRVLLEGIRDYAIFMVGLDGNIKVWTPGAERVIGYSSDEVIGTPFSRFFPEPDRRAGKPERILETARVEGRYEEEGWRVRKDGSRFWARGILTAVRDKNGEISGFAKVTHDMTERKLAEEALHQSEERFRLLVENVRDYAIFMLSAEGRVISWNPGAQKIKGYTTEEIMGQHFSVFYPSEDLERDKPALELEIAVAEGKYEEEGWRLRKDGSRFWAAVVITPIRDPQGNLIGFAKVTRDMTERRRAREQLLATQQKARDLSLSIAAKDEFLGMVAHELRTPLAVLYGSAQMLRNRMDWLEEEDRNDLINALADETERMRALVENLLALARPVAEDSLNLHEELAVTAVRSSVASFLRNGLECPIRVVESGGRDLAIRIEPTYFERVIVNLLENASKYAGVDRPIDIVISPRGESVAIEVQDRGPGVDAAELGLIFESFYRSSRTASNRPGKGLGLAVCKRLVDLMNGSIEASPRVGGGLVFRLILPSGGAEP